MKTRPLPACWKIVTQIKSQYLKHIGHRCIFVTFRTANTGLIKWVQPLNITSKASFQTKLIFKRNDNNLLSLAVLPRIDILKKSDEEIKLAEISENVPELKIVKGRKSDYSS